MGSQRDVNEVASQQLIREQRRVRVVLMLLGDAVLLQVAVLASLLARFDGHLPSVYWDAYAHLWPWYTLGSLAFFAWRGLYRSLWRYAGIEELVNVVGATTLSTLTLTLLSAFYRLPRSVIMIHWVILAFLVSSSRVALRAVRRLWATDKGQTDPTQVSRSEPLTVLIVGAGRIGADLVLPLRQSGRQVVGFLDDDPAKRNMQIHGVRVLGTLDDVKRVVSEHDVQEVLLALPAKFGGRHRAIVDALSDKKVKLHTIPAVNEVIDGKVSVSQIRPVSVSDLLGREAVQLNAEQIAAEISGEVVLVTGAGGSIGSELCRQICRFGPSLLVMLGHGENSVFEAAMDLNEKFPDVPKAQVIADVRDGGKMAAVFEHYQPAYVLHAAAHKHVPYMEQYPDEAVKTNIFGTRNVARAALEHGARRFVMISTDKAVNPTSVMGASKRVAEMVVQDLNAMNKTKFVSVRFGNVLGSRGSVIPVFQRQIAQGGPVTVTDPEMRRYFMTIPEAAQLVLQAAALGQGGEVFILDMGEPVKIEDLARNLITLSGFRPNKDIQIVYTGRRPGEKLFEELVMDEEATSVTEHSRIFICKNALLPSKELEQGIALLEQLLLAGEYRQLLSVLQVLVSTYEPYIPTRDREVATAQ
ncbi:MAG: polysaccharide biosynthesis protein [Limnochordia bacterium]|jgi:FlaA1/EpsC-like NDP-sugar epimerase